MLTLLRMKSIIFLLFLLPLQQVTLLGSFFMCDTNLLRWSPLDPSTPIGDSHLTIDMNLTSHFHYSYYSFNFSTTINA